MHGDTKLLINASRAASRYLQRDVLELENLQNSQHSNATFCQKSCIKVAQSLQKSLSEYFDQIIFTPEDEQQNQANGKIILVKLLDGFENFTRSLPYFGFMLSLINKTGSDIKTYSSVINLPALGEIYYTEQGKGAWLEQLNPQISGARRLRLKKQSDSSNIITATSISSLRASQKISTNLRLFEASSYSLAQLLRGKIDLLIMPPQHLTIAGIKLFLSEAGGIGDIINGNLIATNYELFNKINNSIS